MKKVNVPNEREEKILRENRIDPAHYSVIYKDDTTIRMLCHETRDIVTIHKGDRPW